MKISSVLLTAPLMALFLCGQLHAQPQVGDAFAVDDPLPGNSGVHFSNMLLAANDSGDYLTVWTAGSDLLAARISGGDHSLLDSSPIVVADSEDGYSHRSPQVATDGSNFVIVWEMEMVDDAPGYIEPSIASAVLMASDGSVSPRSSIASAGENPAIVYDESFGFLAAWTHCHEEFVDPQDIVLCDEIRAKRRVAIDGAWENTNISLHSGSEVNADVSLSSVGGTVLAVWGDQRNAASSGQDIYGARLDGVTGTVLDVSGVALCTDLGNQAQPTATASDQEHLIIWQNQSGNSDGWDLHGVLLDVQPGADPGETFEIVEAEEDQSGVDMVFDGADFRVLWQDDRNIADASFNSDIYGSRISATTGENLDPGGIPVLSSEYDETIPKLAIGSQNEILAAWSYGTGAGRSLLAGVLTDDGVPDEESRFLVFGANEQRSPSVAANQDTSLIVWQDRRNHPPGVEDPGYDHYDIYAVRVLTSDQSIIDETPIQISDGTRNEALPSVATDGKNFLVVWTDTRHGNNPPPAAQDLYLAIVDGESAVISPSGGRRLASGSDLGFQYELAYPKALWTGEHYLVVWQACSPTIPNSCEIRGGRVSSNGQTMDDLLGISIVNTDKNTRFPDLAWNGSHAVLVWKSSEHFNDDEPKHIYARRLDSQGTHLDDHPILIAQHNTTLSPPSVAEGGEDVLIVYSQNDAFNMDVRVWAQPVSGNEDTWTGSNLPDPIEIGTTNYTDYEEFLDESSFIPRGTAVASNGSKWLVAYEELLSGTNTRCAYAELSSDFTLVTGPISDEGSHCHLGKTGLSNTNDQFLLVYTDNQLGSWRTHGRFLEVSPTVENGSGCSCDIAGVKRAISFYERLLLLF